MADSLKICVVDDDRDVAEGLTEILQMVGHEVRTVYAGQDALEVLGQEDFDIAFINAELPDLTDLESFMEVRKIKPDLQTVMMTGYTIEQLLRQAVGAGSVNVLQKPVTMDEVVRALDGAKPKGIVLVAEDDPEIGDKIRDTLVLQEHRVKVAHTSKEALETVGASNCDILVLDLRGPVIDALEVYLNLEKQDYGLPTIVISTYPDKRAGPIDVLRDETVTGILIKPFDPARLLKVLERLQPKEPSPPPVEKKEQPAKHVETRGGRILVIDDDQDVAEGMADVLVDLGHTVEIALTGSKALEIAERFDAQIALVDIKLGRTSGLELIASLEKLRPGIINVVITANAGKESVIASLRSGAFDFLNKPTHPRDLFAVLDRCFAKINARKNQKADTTAEEPLTGLSANVGHELRDPLNAVIGFSEILGDEMLGPLGSEQYVHYAKGINQAGQHLTTVIDDLFEDGQAESNIADPGESSPDVSGTRTAEPAQGMAGEAQGEMPPEFMAAEMDVAETVHEEQPPPDLGEPDSVEAAAEMPAAGEPESDEPQPIDSASYDREYWDSSIESVVDHGEGPDGSDPMAADADEPAAPDPETGEPAAHESRLDELYSDRPDIAALFEEVPEAREVDSAETEPAEPDAPDPEAARSDYSDLQVQEPEPSEVSVDAPVPEATELDSLMTDVFDSLESDLPDAPVPDPNWTEPYPDEVDQGAPEWSGPGSYDLESTTLPEDGIGQQTSSADQPETDDAPISGPSPAGSEVLDADPAESTWEEPAAPGPEIVDPFPDEPDAQQMDGDEDDEGDEDREDDVQDGGQKIRNDSGRKILRFGPFKKVI